MSEKKLKEGWLSSFAEKNACIVLRRMGDEHTGMERCPGSGTGGTMIGGLLKVIGGLVVGVVLLGVVVGVLGMVMGLGVALLALALKALPFLLVGWLVLRLVRGDKSRRPAISAADKRWLDKGV